MFENKLTIYVEQPYVQGQYLTAGDLSGREDGVRGGRFPGVDIRLPWATLVCSGFGLSPWRSWVPSQPCWASCRESGDSARLGRCPGAPTPYLRWSRGGRKPAPSVVCGPSDSPANSAA